METKRKGAKVQCDGWKGLDTREGEGHGLAGLIFLAAKYRSTQGKARQSSSKILHPHPPGPRRRVGRIAARQRPCRQATNPFFPLCDSFASAPCVVEPVSPFTRRSTPIHAASVAATNPATWNNPSAQIPVRQALTYICWLPRPSLPENSTSRLVESAACAPSTPGPSLPRCLLEIFLRFLSCSDALMTARSFFK